MRELPAKIYSLLTWHAKKKTERRKSVSHSHSRNTCNIGHIYQSDIIRVHEYATENIYFRNYENPNLKFKLFISI